MHVSIINIDHVAKQIVPLTPLSEFELPPLDYGGLFRLYDGLELLSHCIDTELCRPLRERTGDRRPIVILFTRGISPDSVMAISG